jgi:bleomycin hydrolase
MKRIFVLCAMTMILTALILPGGVVAQKKYHKAKYVKHHRDPVLKSMKEEMDSLRAVADSITAEINREWKEKKKKEEEEREDLRFSFEGVKKPESPGDFDAPFHFPPVPQYYTGTCWSFCTTSFMESEVKRLTGQEIKLSEMFTVYWEYVEKARGYIAKRGNQPFVQGSESDAVMIIWDKYGVVPEYAYTGLIKGNDKHNHKIMHGEMRDYLKFIEEKGYWDEEANIAHIREILDHYIGSPPETFKYKGRQYTPVEFVKKVLEVDTEDYVQLMSTISVPFYTSGKFDVPDNWRLTSTYYNVPLDEFYGLIKKATGKGYTVCIGGDVSEPGYNGFEDAAIVPTFDVPQDYINQDSREFRFYNKTTTDDHGIHLLAHMNIGDRDWFLIKDSSRSSRHGKFRGYYFYRGDYIKLRMLTYTVHRDIVEDLMPRFNK